MGHGRHFISSKKFIAAEGGIERIVWMPKELKDDVAERLNRTAKELYGIDNFTDMIADETICEDCEGPHGVPDREEPSGSGDGAPDVRPAARRAAHPARRVFRNMRTLQGRGQPGPALHLRKKQAVVKMVCTDCVCSGARCTRPPRERKM